MTTKIQTFTQPKSLLINGEEVLFDRITSSKGGVLDLDGYSFGENYRFSLNGEVVAIVQLLSSDLVSKKSSIVFSSIDFWRDIGALKRISTSDYFSEDDFLSEKK